jgi:hypothetical protein
VQEEQVPILDHLHTNHQAIHQREVLVETLVLLEVLVLMLALLVLHHSNHQVSQQVLVLMLVPLVEATSNHHHHLNQDRLVLVMMSQQLAKLLVIQLKPMLLGLNMVLKYEVLVFTSMLIHKSYVDQLQVVFKLTHKTLKCAFFNHHLFHPQA